MPKPKPTGLDHIVVIGASAGGLEALQELASRLPSDANAAYVVAQHLPPAHPSQLVDLLQRKCELRVLCASDGTVLEAGVILVIPPGWDASIDQQAIRLHAPQRRFGPSPSLDQLFDALATHWGERGVAVVLSGTGSDGALGMRAVGAAGGLTLVQTPESARFEGMPRSAIALGGADWIGDPATIASHLGSCFNAQGSWHKRGEHDGENAQEETQLAAATAQLKQCTGIDFSLYKESTLQRQLLRRMAIHGVSSVADYLTLLKADNAEGKALAQNLLVSVTAFFRNPEAYTALAGHLVPLVSRLNPDEKLRVWVPGCATGEEAYSIGMLVSEVMGHPAHLNQRLKIFATDLDEQSLAMGRRGIYPVSAARTIPEELIQRFIRLSEHEIEINKELRSCLVFARHNVAEEPPFPNIDLISFRNTLIYFTSPLQERVLDLFSFSLLPGGLLFLGSSESLGRRSGFTIVNPLHRIYERSREGRPRSRFALSMPVQHPAPIQRLPPAGLNERDTLPNQHVNLLEALLRTIGPPSLVLDENHNLVEVIGDVSAYCRIPEGRLTASVGAFLRDELQSEARALFLLVRADRTTATSRRLNLPGSTGTVRLEAAPLQLGERALTVLSFLQDQGETDGQVSTAGSSSSNERDAAFASEIERLERELLSSQETLRRSMADLEQANEELEASSEELQASSEELQSSNEELEASNEELQATNEELASLNQQLRIRSDELEHLNNDLENIQSSLSQGMVIVDRNLRITRFSPLAVRVFGLVDSDIGQPLIGMPTTVPLPNLREALLSVLEGKERTSIEASSEEVSYLAQVMPYRDKSGERLGAIITLTDVSELVALRQAAEASLREFAKLADSLEQVVWKRDHGMGRILYISSRIKNLTGWSPTELCSDPQRFDEAIDPDDRERVKAARSAQGSGWNVTYRLLDRHGQARMLNEVASVVNEKNDHYVVGTLSDVSSQNHSALQTRLLACGLDTLLSCHRLPFALVDQGLRVVRCSAGFTEVLGLGSSSLSDEPLERLASVLARPDELVVSARQLLLQPQTLQMPTSSGQLRLLLQSVVDESNEPHRVVGLLLALDSASAG